MNKIGRSLLLSLLTVAIAVPMFAQDKGIDVDINVKKETDWYQQPWVWIVGAAVFVLLLVAILKSGSRRASQ